MHECYLLYKNNGKVSVKIFTAVLTFFIVYKQLSHLLPKYLIVTFAGGGKNIADQMIFRNILITKYQPSIEWKQFKTSNDLNKKNQLNIDLMSVTHPLYPTNSHSLLKNEKKKM